MNNMFHKRGFPLKSLSSIGSLISKDWLSSLTKANLRLLQAESQSTVLIQWCTPWFYFYLIQIKLASLTPFQCKDQSALGTK